MEDTICAVATPPGVGGIGIIRLSGEKAIATAARCVRLTGPRTLESAKSHQLYRGDVVEPGTLPDAPSRLLDQALVVVMHGPRSYTGEDVVELHCHGGTLVLQNICAVLMREGARPAEPGEFTKRAFLNGRLDLTQAEAVLDTIHARTDAALRQAQAQLRGCLSRTLEQLREQLIILLAHVEAGIDFVEEDIDFVSKAELGKRVRATSDAISGLIESGREARILREGISIAIVGRPNVGKSSLLNAMLQSDRAIVTPIPGTTRDVLEEVLNIRGVAVRVLDTAGLRDSDDPVEQEGVKRTQRAMEDAEILLIVLDGSEPLTAGDREILSSHPGKRRVVGLNKSDLGCGLDLKEVETYLDETTPGRIARISAKTAEGLDALKDCMRTLILRPDFEPGETAAITRLRHQVALERALEALQHALASIQERMPQEVIAVDLREAADALGEITGTICTDDILERIFQEFCIGK